MVGVVCLMGIVSGGGLLFDFMVRVVVFANVSSVRSRVGMPDADHTYVCEPGFFGC